MAKTVDKKDISKKNTSNVESAKKVKKVTKKDKKKASTEKKSLWARFRIFCNGVKSEFGKVHWPNKKDMLKYSVATILFIIFFALFFYLIEVIFALIQTLFN
ncbi:MAG: preprotein translocase subunit SecE [bacterium]|nr:preprotein translocase subunit SecE [bacterium]